MVSYFVFSGEQGQWQAFLDSACEISIKVLQRSHVAPDWALRSFSDSMRFIIKTSMWFDVLASATLIRRPKFLEVLRSLCGPTTAVNGGRPELCMMDIMGCENRIVLALTDLACWKDECRRAGRFRVSELVRRGKDIETILKSTNVPAHLHARRRRLRLMYFARLPLSISIPSYLGIMHNVQKLWTTSQKQSSVSSVLKTPARHVVRSVVFSICICGCLTDVPGYRRYFLRHLHEQQTGTVGNCAQLMREVWSRRG
ncbi:hypothetical protein BDR03DRAFT_272538 [Suillus americanus]|nr:hypothetical protein BDR03DRAFT_272538 [Suillus americanus]